MKEMRTAFLAAEQTDVYKRQGYKMKIGVRAHDYGKHSIEGLASLLREEGYDGAQLALPKVFEEIDSYEDIRLSHIERIRRAFEKNRVEIPVMGCYMDCLLYTSLPSF